MAELKHFAETNIILPLANRINKLWNRLIGSVAELPIEFRIYHSICIVAMLALAYNVPFNYLIGLPKIALLSLVILLVYAFLYYLSRFKGKMHVSFVLLAIIGNILFIINFFINSGISGPTLLLLTVCLLLMVCIAPKREIKIWMGLNLVIVLALFAAEYFHPEWVPDSYLDRESRFMDMLSAYVVGLVLMYFAIYFFRESYDVERQSAADRAAAIEEKNLQITSQNQELERINGEKNKLMSIIAHDLRSPLGNIQSYLELVSKYDLDAAERQVVEVDLLKVTRNTLDMLSKLLVWSKGQMDGVTVKLSPVNLYDELYSTLEMEKAIAGKKDIDFDFIVDHGIWIIADTDMLQLVIRNLVSNAIKFTLPGGKISLKCKLIGAECWIIIRDNGTGISPEKQETLFSLQATSTTGTQNEKGVGLGLLLCKEFTELQGGKIWLESLPGEGSVFYISMPAAVNTIA